MGKSDVAPLLIITVSFLVLAMFRLGDMTAPQTFFQYSEERSEVLIELHEPLEISSIMYYTGLWTGHYRLEFSVDGEHWIEQGPRADNPSQENASPAMNQLHSHVFKWRYATLSAGNPAVSFIRITASQMPIELGELALFGPGGERISRTFIATNAPELFDEQYLIPEVPTHMNGTYFDEIYHARTAFEYLRGIDPYETTHPPLGKALIAMSIYLFDMTPFGWRFIGAVLGVLLMVVMYVFIKNLFGRTAVAVCGTLLLGFDFMRFVQTRIATIDTYAVLFILLAYYFMYRHITTHPEARFRSSLAPLVLSGVFFGMGCASKWVVVYAGIGLAAIYILRLVHLRKYYRINEYGGYAAYLTKTILFSVLFFGLVPVLIYLISYMPFVLARGLSSDAEVLFSAAFFNEAWRIIWGNQVLMFNYHGGLQATHPFASAWWQWIINARPILYVNNHFGDVRSSFAAFGNPVVWWGGFVAMLFMFYSVFKNRDGKALFILIGYLSQLLPWVVVSRIVFIYHYFPSTLFLVLALAHIFNTILERKRGEYKIAVYGYLVGTGIVFAMFFPALTGLRVPHWYFESLLRWVPFYWPF